MTGKLTEITAEQANLILLDEEKPLDEREFQDRICDFLEHSLKYDNLGSGWGLINSCVETDILRSYLKSTQSWSKWSDQVIESAISAFNNVAHNLNDGLLVCNKKVHDLLVNGVNVYDEEAGCFRTVFLVDLDHPMTNKYAFKQEVSVFKGNREHRRIDIVFYINGIAIGMIELKGPKVDVFEAVRQLISEQGKFGIPSFFATGAFCIAANEAQGLYYGTVGTPERLFFPWLEDAFTAYPEEVDPVTKSIHAHVVQMDEGQVFKQLFSFLDKRRICQFLSDYIIVENDIKKIARYQQYYGNERMTMRYTSYFDGTSYRGTGIINHGPGSGKTISMEIATNRFKRRYKNGQVVLIIDREDLQIQSAKNFGELKPRIVESTENIKEALNDPGAQLVIILIQKFGHIGNNDLGYEQRLREIKKLAGQIDHRPRLIQIDEGHRTQSGILHDVMRMLFDDKETFYVAYTGTPDTESDMNTLLRFGEFIHAYDNNQAVRDGAVVPLCYEARNLEQKITSQEDLDKAFEEEFAEENEIVKSRIKDAWASDTKLRGLPKWMNTVKNDMKKDFTERNSRLMSGHGNAILVVPTIDRAYEYYALFNEDPYFAGKVFPITSYRPTYASLRTTQSTIEGDDIETLKYEYATQMFGKNDPDEFEADIKNKFMNHPDEVKLFILVDRLNTGFDAQPISAVYIDRDIKKNSLVYQTATRANRVDPKRPGKDKALIVDYSGNYKSYHDALRQFTLQTVLTIIDKDDPTILPTLIDPIIPAADAYIKAFEKAESEYTSMLTGIPQPQTLEEFKKHFCGSTDPLDVMDTDVLCKLLPLRDKYYRCVSAVAVRWHDARLYYIDKYGIEKTRKVDVRVKNYVSIKEQIMRASGDKLDVRRFDDPMRKILDEYIETSEEPEISYSIEDVAKILEESNDIATDVEKWLARNNKNASYLFIPLAGFVSQRIMQEEATVGSGITARLSLILSEILEKRKQKDADLEDLTRQLLELADRIKKREYDDIGKYPDNIETNLKRALYDEVANKDAELANRIYDTLRHQYRAPWADPTLPPSDRCFRPAQNALYTELNLAPAQIDKSIQLGRANVSELAK